MSKFNSFSPIYSFATENLVYLDYLNIKNKKILTVGSSFDHAIYSCYLGAHDITNFDINKIAYFYSQLKLMALQYLSYSEFINFFMINPNSFNYFIYKKIRSRLSSSVQSYWDKVYFDYKENGYAIRTSDIFNNSYDTMENKIFNCPYLKNDLIYTDTQKAVRKLQFKWTEINVENLCNHFDEFFDIIILSNISDYSHYMFEKDHLIKYKQQIVLPLTTKLNKNGTIMFGYVFDAFNLLDSDKRNPFNNPHIRKKAYENIKGFTYQEFWFDSSIAGAQKDCACVLHHD